MLPPRIDPNGGVSRSLAKAMRKQKASVPTHERNECVSAPYTDQNGDDPPEYGKIDVPTKSGYADAYACVCYLTTRSSDAVESGSAPVCVTMEVRPSVMARPRGSSNRIMCRKNTLPGRIS